MSAWVPSSSITASSSSRSSGAVTIGCQSIQPANRIHFDLALIQIKNRGRVAICEGDALTRTEDRRGGTLLGVDQSARRIISGWQHGTSKGRRSWCRTGYHSLNPLYANPLISIRIVVIQAHGQSKSKFQTCANCRGRLEYPSRVSGCRAGSDSWFQKQNRNRRMDERRTPHRLAALSGLREVVLSITTEYSFASTAKAIEDRS